MWQAVKFVLLAFCAVGLFLLENTPSGLRDNICSWKILYPCPEWFGVAHVDDALQILVWLLIVGLLSSLIVPVVLADYRHTIAFMATSMVSKSPCSAGDRQQDPKLISLSEAVLIAYEQTRGTKVATIAEGLNRDDILGYYAHALFNGKTTLYGNHPPSRILEAIPNEEYGRCGFSDDQNALHRHGEHRNLYENLQIKRSDVDRRIAELKSAATAPHEVRLSDALYWIIDNSDWGPGLGRNSFLDQAAIVLRQAAKDEEITIRGRREIDPHGPGDRFDQTWENIEPSYWRTHEFEMTALMCAEPHFATCETVVVSPGDITAESMPHCAMLRVWNDELERRWPAVNTSA